LSRLDDGVEFWDIGFLKAWNNSSNTFGDGTILKLANALPDGVSIGNPTFSKNSPHIIAFEEAESDFFGNTTYSLIGANIETGESNTIFENSKLNFPNYGVADDRIVFDAVTNEGNDVLAVIPVGDDKITAAGSAQGLINGGHWGIYFADGQRQLDTGVEGPIIADDGLLVYPTIFNHSIVLEHETDNLAGSMVQLMDITGRPVKTITLGGANRQTIATGDLPAGTYLLAVIRDNGTAIQRVIKQ
ncbi:MAG: T9SS type A sorting domain-containing protein, partial [Bacteroidota bacterium]